MIDLEPYEIAWQSWNSEEMAQRIRALIHYRLQHVSRDEQSHDHPYRDPSDGRFWELVYPWPEHHGGGAYRLVVIAPADAAAKYPVQPANESLRWTGARAIEAISYERLASVARRRAFARNAN